MPDYFVVTCEHGGNRVPPPGAAIVGIEIEINQAIGGGAPRRWSEVRAAMIESLRVALART